MAALRLVLSQNVSPTVSPLHTPTVYLNRANCLLLIALVEPQCCIEAGVAPTSSPPRQQTHALRLVSGDYLYIYNIDTMKYKLPLGRCAVGRALGSQSIDRWGSALLFQDWIVYHRRTHTIVYMWWLPAVQSYCLLQSC